MELVTHHHRWPLSSHAIGRLWERFKLTVPANGVLDWNTKPIVSLCKNVIMPGPQRRSCSHHLVNVDGQIIVIIVGRDLARKGEPAVVLTVLTPEIYATQSWAVSLSGHLESLATLEEYGESSTPAVWSWQRFLTGCGCTFTDVTRDDLTGTDLSLGTFLKIGASAHVIVCKMASDKHLKALLDVKKWEYMLQHSKFAASHYGRYAALCLGEAPALEVSHSKLAEHLSTMSETEFMGALVRGGIGDSRIVVASETFWYDDSAEAAEDFKMLQKVQSFMVRGQREKEVVEGYCV